MSVIMQRIQDQLKPTIYLGILVLIVLEIAVLSPITLELDRSASPNAYVDPAELLEQIVVKKQYVAPDIPKGIIPDESIDNFHFISSRSGQKEWKVIAEITHNYKKQDLIHGQKVTAYLYDSDGKTTLIEGNESKIIQKIGLMEIFGDVKTVFPDGFTIFSDYMKYDTQARIVTVPDTLLVWGEGRAGEGNDFRFKSYGLRYDMVENKINLYREVHMSLEKVNETTGMTEVTTIQSDRCLIDRQKKVAHFSMFEDRNIQERFVKINQPNLFVRSRLVDFHYQGARGFLRTLISKKDVFIHETGKNDEVLRYATCGEAEFQNDLNVVVLTKYPQVYQDTDTVTGDVIVIHRSTDIVEVKQSNAFSDSTSQF